MTWLFFALFLFSQTYTLALDSIIPGNSIKDGDVLVSEGGKFELGFFSPNNSKNRYLGIWYKEPSAHAVIWVANRENPIVKFSGVLNFTKHGQLVLFSGENNTIWSSYKTGNIQNPVLQLLDSGNLVVRDGNDVFLWQSFDHPIDTMLPGMKIGRNFRTGEDKFLTSSKSENDPGKGQLSLWIDPAGFPQLVLRNGTAKYYRLGSWNGFYFTGFPQLLPQNFLQLEFGLSSDGVYYGYKVPDNSSLMTRLYVNESGFVESFARTDQTIGWQNIYSVPLDECDKYAVCGAHMKCKIVDNSVNCVCLEGFVPKSPTNLSYGCVRMSELDCEEGDMFHEYVGLKLPDTSESWYDTSLSHEKCKEKCSRNCSCTAYATSNISNGGSGCLLWFGPLVDIREYTEGGQQIYIRRPPLKQAQGGQQIYMRRPSLKQGQAKKKLIGLIVSGVILLGMILVGIFVHTRRKKQRMEGLTIGSYINDQENKEVKEDVDLPIFDLNIIVKATDNFSSHNKLGQGGFGPVYKGILSDGKEIAVKRLSASSGQGLTEFKNEVILISKLQHRNLVKLLGCCIQNDEKMLIYEFMPNQSLDNFIFDKMRSKFLDWNKRAHIIDGIARGLLYLHQDSRLRIIHRDLKASNVLLDKDMNPKISDFGMARIFGGDQTEANTNKVAGTYGYMAPEYAVDGLFSMKSDVFSFGVLVIEIISGKKNRGFFHPDHGHNLLGHAWKLWLEEMPLDLVDKMLDSFEERQVLRCIHVGLSCVQQKPEDRPNMSTVVVMLGSESSLAEPKQPGFFTERDMPGVDFSSSGHVLSSINEMSTTIVEPR